MGYFTWTDAKKEPRKNKHGEFYRSDLIAKGGYDGFAKIVCPDDIEITEPYYEGYGIFGGQDVYELVVDWNRDHLEEIFDRLEKEEGKEHWGHDLRPIAIAYQNHKEPNLIEEEAERLSAAPFFGSDWKRTLGITIACDHNEWLPFPIKITSKKWHVKYNDLVPSYGCQ